MQKIAFIFPLLLWSLVLSAQNVGDADPKANNTDKTGLRNSVTVGGIPASFTVSPAGGAVYSVPVEVPAGINGLQPTIGIVYNSQSGNGVVGWGGSLSGVSCITRAPRDIYHDGKAGGITHLAKEAYYLDGVRLIYQYGSGKEGEEGAI